MLVICSNTVSNRCALYWISGFSPNKSQNQVFFHKKFIGKFQFLRFAFRRKVNKLNLFLKKLKSLLNLIWESYFSGSGSKAIKFQCKKINVNKLRSFEDFRNEFSFSSVCFIVNYPLLRLWIMKKKQFFYSIFLVLEIESKECKELIVDIRMDTNEWSMACLQPTTHYN